MIYARIIALLLKWKPLAWLLGAVGLIAKIKLDDARADKLREAGADLEAHERLNDVQDFSGSTDGERIERLHDFAAKHGNR